MKMNYNWKFWFRIGCLVSVLGWAMGVIVGIQMDRMCVGHPHEFGMAFKYCTNGQWFGLMLSIAMYFTGIQIIKKS